VSYSDERSLIRGLFGVLPPGPTWPAKRRRQWLVAAAAVLDVVYLDEERGTLRGLLAEQWCGALHDA